MLPASTSKSVMVRDAWALAAPCRSLTFQHPNVAFASRASLKIRRTTFASENFFSKAQKSWPKNEGWQADFARSAPRKKSHAKRRRGRLLRLLSGAPRRCTQKQKSLIRRGGRWHALGLPAVSMQNYRRWVIPSAPHMATPECRRGHATPRDQDPLGEFWT